MSSPIQFRSCNALFPCEPPDENRNLLSSFPDQVSSDQFSYSPRNQVFNSQFCNLVPFRSAKLFSQKPELPISPELMKEMIKNFGEVFSNGQIAIKIPMKAGDYEINTNLLSVKYKVKEQNLLIDLRFAENGKITKFEISLDPPLPMDIHIKIPIFSPLLFPDGVPKLLKSIYLNPKNGKLFSRIKNLPDINLTSIFLKYLNAGNSGQKAEFPKTIVELLQAIFKILAKKDLSSANAQGKSFKVPVDFEKAKIVQADFQLKNGESKIGPILVKTDPSKNNILTIYDSNLSELNIRMPELSAVTIPLQNNQQVQLHQLKLGVLHLKIKDKIYLSGNEGRIQSAESNLRKIDVRNGQISWETLSGTIDLTTFASTLDLNGVQIASLKGKIPPKSESIVFPTETNFEFSSILGRRASLVYLPGKKATIGLEKAELDIQKASGKNLYGEAELDPTHLKNTDIQVIIGFLLPDPNDYSVDLTIKTTSSLFRIRKGAFHLPGFDEKIKKEGYSFGFNPSTISDFEFAIERGKLEVKGNADLDLSDMLIRLGSGIDLPFKADFKLRNTKITGHLDDLIVLNLFDPNPATLQLSARGDLKLFSHGGKGEVSSRGSVNRFRLVTDQLGVESHLQSFTIYDGLIQAMEANKTILRLGKLHGKVSSFQHYGTKLENVSSAVVGFDYFKVDLEKLRSFQRRINPADQVKLGGYQVYPIGEFRKFKLQLYALSHENTLYLIGEPDDDEQVTHKKLFSQSVNASIQQEDNIMIAYDPKGRRVIQIFLGKGPAIFIESDGTALLKNFIPE